MTTALTTTNNDGATLLAIIQQASQQPDLDIAKMQQLMELKREWDKDRAAETYSAAITEFQKRCPQIHKGRKPVSGPSYTYASYDDVMAVAAPILAECGIAVTFSQEQVEKSLRVTCRLRVGTHAEDHTFTVPVPDMRVNDTQRFGAALSYAKRYAICGALNIVTTDEDTDAAECFDPITQDQEVQIIELLEAKGIDKVKFLAWLGVDRIVDIRASDFQKAVDALRRKQ